MSFPVASAQDDWPLQQVFGKANVAVVQTSGAAVVEQCTGDVCKRFALKGADSLTVLHDFAFLYLALVENYDIEQIKSPGGERYFQVLLQRRKGTCAGANEAEVARCALAAMAAQYPVTGSITQMVDGWNRRESWDIQAELRRAKIVR
jgi:hypothetical protein